MCLLFFNCFLIFVFFLFEIYLQKNHHGLDHCTNLRLINAAHTFFPTSISVSKSDQKPHRPLHFLLDPGESLFLGSGFNFAPGFFIVIVVLPALCSLSTLLTGRLLPGWLLPPPLPPFVLSSSSGFETLTLSTGGCWAGFWTCCVSFLQCSVTDFSSKFTSILWSAQSLLFQLLSPFHVFLHVGPSQSPARGSGPAIIIVSVGATILLDNFKNQNCVHATWRT